MGFEWSSLAGPFASLFGGGIDAGISAKMAAQNRQFQERMYKNRYQYQMQDMKAAGLNPILAFGQSPPGSPPGAIGKGTNFGASLGASARVGAELKLLQAQQRKTGNEADLTAIQAYGAAMGLKGIKGVEKVLRDAIEKHGPSAKAAFAIPTQQQIFPHGPPGEAGIQLPQWLIEQTRPTSARGNQ